MYFLINHQQMILNKQPFVVGNSNDYLTAEFSFSEDWDGLAKVAFFGNGTNTYAFLLVDDKITADKHLNLAGGEWAAWLYGFDGEVTDVTELPENVMRISTNRVCFDVKMNGGTNGEVIPLTPTGIGEQILLIAQAAAEIAQSVRDDADAGEFDGAPGEKGDSGQDGQDGVSPTVSISTITGGHRITITDAQGAHTADVLDGSGAGDMQASVYDPQGKEADVFRYADDAAAAVQSDVDDIAGVIPAQATQQNQLADKDFVNSSVQTATANFRGNWDNWTAVPTDARSYPQDYSGTRTPTTNDYMVVVDASDVPYTDPQTQAVAYPYEGTWRFKYGGVWATDGKNGWHAEYQVNETPLTAAQLAALNSGITSGKVSGYDAHAASTANPHGVTKSQVGLGNVDNTSDATKKSNFTGSIASGNTGFVTGGDVYTLVGNLEALLEELR